MRAIWVARFHYHDPADIAEIMRACRAIGVNTVLWANGNGCIGGCLAITALVLVQGQVITESDISLNDSVIWKRFGTWAWPTSILIDRKGFVRYQHIGEGGYAETEAMIERLLGEGG